MLAPGMGGGYPVLVMSTVGLGFWAIIGAPGRPDVWGRRRSPERSVFELGLCFLEVL